MYSQDLTPRTLFGDSLFLRNSAHASLTLANWRKEAPSIRLWTLRELMETLPL